MITTSTEFEDLALSGAKWYAKADNIADEMENITYSHIGNPDDVFTIGNTASAILEFDIINPTQSYDNLVFKAQQGIKTSEGMEYIDLGVFKVLNAILDGIKVSVKAVDKMTYLMSDKYVPQVTVPTTDIAILNDIASQTGITVDTSNLTSHNITYLTNAYSKREIIGYISALQGKNAYFTSQGNLAFKFYDAIDYTVDDDRLYFDSPTNVNSEKDFTCQYIKCDVYVNGTMTELTSGSGDMGISIINPFMTQTILNEVLTKINTLTFRPMEIEFLGDFRLQIGDVITVETNGNAYTVPIMQINHSSDGGVITNVVSIAKTESENAIEVKSDFMQRFDKMIFDLVETREITDENAQKIVEQGTQIQAVQGAITSKVWQEDIDSSKATNSVSGNTPIVLTDSADGGYIGMNIYGRSTQAENPTPDNPQEIESVGYENLLENTATSQTIYGVSFTVNKDKSVTVKGKATETAQFYLNMSINLSKSKKYTLSGCPKGGNSSTYALTVSDSSYTDDNFDYGDGKTFIPTTSNLYRVRIIVFKGASVNNTFYPMITKADVTNAPYVPYGSKYVNVKSRNKSLINSYRTSTALAIYNTVLYIDTPLKPSTTYTLSFNSNISFKIYASEHTFIDTLYGKAINVGRNSITLTTKDTISKDDASQWLSPYGWHILKLAANITTAFNPTDVQWEEGNTATDYVVPQTSTLTIATENGLNSIGDVKDEIDLARGIYAQKIGKQVYSNVEWSVQQSGYISTPRLNIPANMKNAIEGKDSQFISNIGNAIWTGNPYINFETNLTLDEFKTAISDIDVVVYYVLPEPLEISLTEDEIAQYRALKTYNPTTVISVTDNPTVDVENYRNSADGQGLANSTVRTETQIEQLANKISLIVKSGDNVTEIELTPEMAKVIAETISLNGDVEISGDMIVDGAVTTAGIIKSSDYKQGEKGMIVDLTNKRIWAISNEMIEKTSGTFISDFDYSSGEFEYGAIGGATKATINILNGEFSLNRIILDDYGIRTAEDNLALLFYTDNGGVHIRKFSCNSLLCDGTAIFDNVFTKDIKAGSSISNSVSLTSLGGYAQFTTTSIVPADEEIARITSGGYYQVGKRVFVQMTISPRMTLAANNYHELFTGFPKPVTSCASLSACLMDEPARLDAYIDGGNGTLVINTSATLASGLTIGITGSYICE